MRKLIVALACIACLLSCENDDFTGNNITTDTDNEALLDQQFQNENFGNATTGKFIGTVTDVSGTILRNVQVSIGNVVTLTDRNGKFVLNDVPVFENFAYIQAKKDGFLDGSKVVIPKTEGENIIQIRLIKKQVNQTINSGETSQVTLSNGASITFSGDFITDDGSPYNGAVDVVTYYLPPAGAINNILTPGSLFARDANNNARTLESYGMMSVSLFSPSGDVLNINPDSPATIEMPVYIQQSSVAPQTIKLWYFDEEVGYWKEDGQATRDGEKYIGEVSHFTWWNIDIPFNPVELCFTLAPTDTNAATYFAMIRLASTNSYIYTGQVNAFEAECGFVPENEELDIYVYNVIEGQQCSFQLIYQETVGGFTTDTAIDISFQDSLTTTNITGTATNCDGNVITDGYLYIDSSNTFSITDGTINVNIQSCTNTSTETIQIFDFTTGQWALIENVVLDGTPINLGTVSTCDDTGGIFNGSITFASQQEIDDFGTLGFSAIGGSMSIGVVDSTSDITDLTPLSSITSVEDNILITGNENLISLAGLENITTVGSSITIENNASLTSLAGFDSLTSVAYLSIINNDALTSLVSLNSATTLENSLNIIGNDGLTSLQGIDAFSYDLEKDIKISGNNALTSLQGMESVTQARFLTISDNTALTSLNGLENITQVLDLTINNNDALVTLIGLESLVELRILIVANNENLENLNGLNSLTTFTPSIFNAVNIGAIQWENFCSGYIDGPNPSLTDFCAIQSFMNLHPWDNSGSSLCAVIVNNEFNPTVQDFLDGNCSQ